MEALLLGLEVEEVSISELGITVAVLLWLLEMAISARGDLILLEEAQELMDMVPGYLLLLAGTDVILVPQHFKLAVLMLQIIQSRYQVVKRMVHSWRIVLRLLPITEFLEEQQKLLRMQQLYISVMHHQDQM